VTFLQNFVYRNQGLERLNFVGKHRLTIRDRSATKSVIISGKIATHFKSSRTLSCQPRRRQKTCGPTYRRYSSGHVSLVNKDQWRAHIRGSRGRCAQASQRVICVRFGAVSSADCKFQISHTEHWKKKAYGILLGTHTDACCFPDVDREISLGATWTY
jgi:hypothetical protein